MWITRDRNGKVVLWHNYEPSKNEEAGIWYSTKRNGINITAAEEGCVAPFKCKWEDKYPTLCSLPTRQFDGEGIELMDQMRKFEQYKYDLVYSDKYNDIL